MSYNLLAVKRTGFGDVYWEFSLKRNAVPLQTAAL